MMNQEPKRSVTLEDLLCLKRTERPPAEFWSEFDHELRAKQLAALVEKRPWWRSVPRMFGSLSRYHLPLGATTILALTVLTVREYRSAVPPVISHSGKGVAAVVSSLSISGNDSGPIREASPLVVPLAATASGASSADRLTLNASAPARLAEIIPVLSLSQSVDVDPEATPTTRFISANFALAKASEPAGAQSMLGNSRGFESRAMPAKTPLIEPLSQMQSPSDVRRSRLLNGAAMAVSMNTPVAARSAEIRSRHISDEQLYDTISRFGAHGAGGFIKF